MGYILDYKLMQFLNALSLAPDVNDWLANSFHLRILHVFDHACNLINERREILSIVTPQIGNGPFNLVVKDDVLFSDYLHAQSPISIRANQLYVGDLTINTDSAKLWSPYPNWERLHAKRDVILNQLTSLPITAYQILFPNSLISNLSLALANANLSPSLSAVQKLAGLGQGLTPAGDDFIMGALYAAWIIHPHEVASILAKEIARAAAPLTTSLSAAWLRSAGNGEAGVLWHEFFATLLHMNILRAQAAMDKILAIGETSGADALSGFTDIFSSYAEREIKLCHS